MYKVDLPVDQSIEKAVERRRSAETARKARIFNPRVRVMGVALDVLNQQVQEKKHRQNMEQRQDKAFDKLREYHDNMLLQQDTEERERRAAVHADLVQHWVTQQHVEDSSDAGLKCGLKGAAMITIPESELGPASMQVFQGEGIREVQMKREQIKKTERDLRVQKEDQARRFMGNKHREMLVSRELMHQDVRGVQEAALEEECKKALRMALDNYNRALAAEQAEKLREQHRREERENRAEMWHILTSDMMTECAEAAGTTHRVVTDRWKGMSPEQLSTIHREREAQRHERQRQRDAEKMQDATWDLQLLKLSREAEDEETKAAELRRQRRIQTDQYNVQLAREQQTHQEFLNQKLYTNKPTKNYFNQFNTSSR
ncbi:RIB43A-like with coiled-coils protein 1 [Solea solea]|uniref:RIB43A-like with coiled-coils protein 1 n=1 Tax=Solea solea TaxID=90069 RepID=UPI00272A3E3F|nr:RIB43A-like with coiled-coils protein 1 [Solea solea]